jgi:paraquat-inducible protein A
MSRLVACHTCDLVQRLEELPPGAVADCARCRARLAGHRAHSLARALAFTLAALAFYVPANLYPILEMNLYGVHTQNTVWEACLALLEQDERAVALVVFVASIVSPAVKLLGLFVLIATTAIGSRRWQRGRTRIYRGLEVIGPWAMLDVFLVAILVALVKLGQLATVVPGRGLLAFTALVVLTFLASASFDRTLIWQAPTSRS